MKRPILIAVLLVTAAVLAGQGHASYLETDPAGGGNTERRIVPPPPPPTPPNEITRLIDRLSIGRPYTTRNLTVFPLYLDGKANATDYVTLDTALAKGWLTVREKDQGVVEQVTVRNVSDHTIFLMAGEIISGAKQNRVIRTDTLLRPNGPDVTLPVYCVEQGRWVGRTMAFGSKSNFAGNALRYKAQSNAGQRVVWEEVKRVSTSAGVVSDTSNFEAVLDDKAVKEALGEYVKVMPEPPRRCMGAVIVINNRIVGVEAFSDDLLFAVLWPKVRRGYALDAYPIFADWEKMPRPIRPIREREVRAYLRRVHRARFTVRDGIDLGKLYTVRGNSIGGEGLVFEPHVVHVNFAPARFIILPGPRRLRIERQEMQLQEETE